jgi:hypothetical protein
MQRISMYSSNRTDAPRYAKNIDVQIKSNRGHHAKQRISMYRSNRTEAPRYATNIDVQPNSNRGTTLCNEYRCTAQIEQRHHAMQRISMYGPNRTEAPRYATNIDVRPKSKRGTTLCNEYRCTAQIEQRHHAMQWISMYSPNRTEAPRYATNIVVQLKSHRRHHTLGLRLHRAIILPSRSRRLNLISFTCDIWSFRINKYMHVRFQVLTAASMKFRFVFWDILPCKIIVDRRFRGTCMYSGDL